MKTINAFVLALGLTAVITACDSKNESPVGNWTAAAPQSVTASVDGAVSASKTLSFDFVAPVGNAAGEVVMTADYDVTVPFVTDSATNSKTYQVKATVKGTWSQKKHENDEYILSFDKNSISVSGTNAPELGPVTDDFISSLATFTAIEDVEVSKDGSHMTFETDHPEVKYNFVSK